MEQETEKNLKPDDLKKKAKRYEAIKLIVGITESVLSFVVLLLFLLGGYSVQLRDYVQGITANPYWQFLLYSAILGAGLSVITVPFSFFSGFYLEHRYGLSNQTFFGWLWEKTKTFLVGLVVILPVALIFYFLLLHYPKTWWLWISIVLFIVSVILGRIAPQVILPLFYKFEPIDNPELKERMERLAKNANFRLQGVYRFNMSKDTKKANAAFTGMGKSKRIIIGDTLLENYSVDEIEAVFAHEVGHYWHKHLHKLLIWGTVETFVGFYLVALLYQWLLGLMGFHSPADLAALPLITLILTIYTLIVSPISNTLSRHFERQADRYAVEHSSDPLALATALEKLSAQNLTDAEPHPLVEFLFHSHPSVQSRVRMVREFVEKERMEMTKDK